jgi:hypothetical protein
VIEAPANESQDDRFFRKSFLKTRVVVGVIGILLPFVLVIGNWMVFGQSRILPSLSDYYHSDMRNWFVGSLWAIGSGLASTGVRVCSRSGGCNSQGVPAENHEGRADHDLPDRF